MATFTDSIGLTRNLLAFNTMNPPGQPEMAHKTDEFCHISKIQEGVKIYTKIAEEWSR